MCGLVSIVAGASGLAVTEGLEAGEDGGGCLLGVQGGLSILDGKDFKKGEAALVTLSVNNFSIIFQDGSVNLGAVGLLKVSFRSSTVYVVC